MLAETLGWIGMLLVFLSVTNYAFGETLAGNCFQMAACLVWLWYAILLALTPLIALNVALFIIALIGVHRRT
jgi:hypothetical protein